VSVDGTTNSLCPKLAKGLLAHRKAGKWGSTQENCSSLLALDKYFQVYEKDVPDLTAQLWLGDNYAGKQVWKGRTTATKMLQIPMEVVMEGGDKDMIIAKEGKGRLYYRVGLTYAPKNLELKAASYGFKVTRRYSGPDNADHVTKTQDGKWKFALGQRIKVTLTMASPMRRYHVALCDFLPAGLEPLNPALQGQIGAATSSQVQRGGGHGWWGYWYSRDLWMEHQNMRDERVEAFTSLLWEGEYEYSFFARATTRGNFVIPPAHAEEMYSPEVFGRTATEFCVIE